MTILGPHKQIYENEVSFAQMKVIIQVSELEAVKFPSSSFNFPLQLCPAANSSFMKNISTHFPCEIRSKFLSFSGFCQIPWHIKLCH
jgi:hypothetical protein